MHNSFCGCCDEETEQNRTEITLFWNIVPRPLASGIREQSFDKAVNTIYIVTPKQ